MSQVKSDSNSYATLYIRKKVNAKLPPYKITIGIHSNFTSSDFRNLYSIESNYPFFLGNLIQNYPPTTYNTYARFPSPAPNYYTRKSIGYGIFINIRKNSNVSLQAELIGTTKGDIYKINVQYFTKFDEPLVSTTIEDKFTMRYLEFPLSLKFASFDKIKTINPYAYIGISPSVLLASKFKRSFTMAGDEKIYSDTILPIISKIPIGNGFTRHRFDLGVLMGAGIDIRLGERFMGMLDIRCNLSLFPVGKFQINNATYSTSNKTWYITAGLGYTLFPNQIEKKKIKKPADKKFEEEYYFERFKNFNLNHFSAFTSLGIGKVKTVVSKGSAKINDQISNYTGFGISYTRSVSKSFAWDVSLSSTIKTIRFKTNGGDTNSFNNFEGYQNHNHLKYITIGLAVGPQWIYDYSPKIKFTSFAGLSFYRNLYTFSTYNSYYFTNEYIDTEETYSFTKSNRGVFAGVGIYYRMVGHKFFKFTLKGELLGKEKYSDIVFHYSQVPGKSSYDNEVLVSSYNRPWILTFSFAYSLGMLKRKFDQ